MFLSTELLQGSQTRSRPRFMGSASCLVPVVTGCVTLGRTWGSGWNCVFRLLQELVVGYEAQFCEELGPQDLGDS